jgi:hypothetical protein
MCYFLGFVAVLVPSIYLNYFCRVSVPEMLETDIIMAFWRMVCIYDKGFFFNMKFRKSSSHKTLKGIVSRETCIN